MLYCTSMSAVKQHNKYDPTFVKQVRDFFIENSISLEDLAERALELFGKSITKADILAMSRTDVDGPWSVQKANNGRRTEDTPVSEQVRNVANILYDLMFDTERPLPPTQLAQVAKTWSDLVDKAKLMKETTSAKVPAQRAKDIFAEEEAKWKNESSTSI